MRFSQVESPTQPRTRHFAAVNIPRGVTMDRVIASGAESPAAMAFSRIMVVIEHFDRNLAAAHQGVALAKAHGADLLFVDLLRPGGGRGLRGGDASTGPLGRLLEGSDLIGQKRQAQAMALARVHGVAAQICGLASARHVADAATFQRCDVIVVANPGRNAWMRLLLGRLVPRLISQARVPVLVCPAGNEAAPENLKQRLVNSSPRPTSQAQNAESLCINAP